MDPVLLVLGAAVSASAVIAVSGRDMRLSTVGLVAVLTLSPFVADPLPDPLVSAARIVAGVLAATLIRFAARPSPMTIGARIGWPATAVGAAAGFVAGYAAHGVIGAAAGPPAAGAAAVAVAAVAIAPSVERHDIVRLTTGLLLLLAAADLLRAATLGSHDGLGQLLAGVAMVAVAAAGAALMTPTRDATLPASTPGSASTGRLPPARRGHIPVDRPTSDPDEQPAS